MPGERPGLWPGPSPGTPQSSHVNHAPGLRDDVAREHLAHRVQRADSVSLFEGHRTRTARHIGSQDAKPDTGRPCIGAQPPGW